MEITRFAAKLVAYLKVRSVVNLIEHHAPTLEDHLYDPVALHGQMMEGFLDATLGSILIEGRSVHSSMQGNAGLVGICPQHDLLWESLTGREHLLFYARLHAFTVSEENRKETDCTHLYHQCLPLMLDLLQ